MCIVIKISGCEKERKGTKEECTWNLLKKLSVKKRTTISFEEEKERERTTDKRERENAERKKDSGERM